MAMRSEAGKANSRSLLWATGSRHTINSKFRILKGKAPIGSYVPECFRLNITQKKKHFRWGWSHKGWRVSGTRGTYIPMEVQVLFPASCHMGASTSGKPHRGPKQPGRPSCSSSLPCHHLLHGVSKLTGGYGAPATGTVPSRSWHSRPRCCTQREGTHKPIPGVGISRAARRGGRDRGASLVLSS